MVYYTSDEDTEFEEIPSEETFDDVDETEGNALERIKKLKEELHGCQKERKEYLDGWQRAKADYLNSKKRYEDERTATVGRIERAFIERLLPLADSFDMAEKGQKGKREAKQDSAWDAGYLQIHSQLRTVLQNFGVAEIEALGQAFDPNLHEALSTQAVTEEAEHDRVLEVLQKGYVRGDILLRPAKVVIGALDL